MAVDAGRAEAPSPEPFPALPPARWRALETIPVFVVALVVQFLVLLAVAPQVVDPQTRGGLIQSCGARFVAALVVTELAFAGAVLAWVRVVSRARPSALGAPRRPLGDVVAGALTGGILVALGYLAIEIVVVVYTSVVGRRPPEPEQIDACVKGLSLTLAGPAVVLAPPIGE